MKKAKRKKVKISEKKKQRHKWIWPRNEDGSKFCAKCAIQSTSERVVRSICKRIK
jgi:hypothetical protein